MTVLYKKTLLEQFPSTGQKGEIGEDWLLKVLKSCNYQVTDYKNQVVAQKQGYDFGIYKPGWLREYTLDCKNNLWYNNKMYCFKIEILKYDNLGWFWKSKADRIYHVSTYTQTYLMYDLIKMRAFILKELLKTDSSIIKSIEYNNCTLLQIAIPEEDLSKYPVSVNNDFFFK